MPVETRRIKLGDRTVTYSFQRKSVRNINLRIRLDGSIAVSAPHACPMEKVRDFLHANAARILHALDKIDQQQKEARVPPSPEYPIEGAPVLLFGKTYRLHITVGRERGMRIEGDTLVLTRTERDGDPACRRIFREFCTDRLREIAERVLTQYAASFEGTAAEALRTVGYTPLRSVWGLCSKKDGRITLNLRLVYVPTAAIEYVVVHEMTHLLYADHSKRFYAALEKRMPDYRARRELLRNVTTRAKDLF